ncbi:hypothetical protein C8Q72DRAFT_841104 [Fomitopsis betulina]|nr:hypothetical protein C8Q72DRAFT_841104 [Fomitopsis betulina]
MRTQVPVLDDKRERAEFPRQPRGTRSQRRLPHRSRPLVSQTNEEEDDVYVPSDSEESVQTTEAENADTGQHRPSRAPATRRRRRQAPSSETENPDERFSGTIEGLQDVWRRAQAENKDLREQLAKLESRTPQRIDSPWTRQRTEQYINDLEERVYSLCSDNATLRLENCALLKQARKGKQSASVSDSDSEEADSTTALNSDAAALSVLHKSQRMIRPESAVFENNGQRAKTSSSSPRELTMKLLLRRVTHAMNVITRYNKTDYEACLTRQRIRWRLPCGHALCHACMVGPPSASGSGTQVDSNSALCPCAVCKHTFQKGESVRTGKVLEDEWAALRSVARKWGQVDHDPLDVRDEELEAGLALLRGEDTEYDNEDNDGVRAAVDADEASAETDVGRVEVDMIGGTPVPIRTSRSSSLATPSPTPPRRNKLRRRKPYRKSYLTTSTESSPAPTGASRSSSLATPPLTPPPSYTLRKRKQVSYRISSRSASPGEDPEIHPGSTVGLRRFTKRRRVLDPMVPPEEVDRPALPSITSPWRGARYAVNRASYINFDSS